MNRKRVLGDGEVNVYHCVSRTVNGEFLFRETDLEIMRRSLFQVAQFCGVRVMAYALMTNHFHILVSVDKRAKDVSDDELLKRYRRLYPEPTQYQTAEIAVMEEALAVGTEEGRLIRERLKARMGDLGEFMKTLKQRFSVYFNRNHGRFGTLWAERFSSTLVEDCPEALRTVAAYIELNPVRAGLVHDPKDYRFCSFAEALAGRASINDAICYMMRRNEVRAAQDAYRKYLFAKGAVPKKDGTGACIDPRRARAVIESENALSQSEIFLHRMRHFSRGVVIGSQQFVEQHLPKIRSRPERSSRGHATPLPHPELGELSSLVSPKRTQRETPA